MVATWSVLVLILARVSLGQEENAVDAELSPNDKILEIFNQCECVMYYLCDDENYIIPDGRGLIEPRIGQTRPVTRIACEKQYHFCCKVRNGTTQDKNTKPPTTPQTTTTQLPPTTPGVKDKNPQTSTTPQPPRRSKCGIPRPVFTARISSDQPTAVPGEFPWIVAILRDKSKGNQRFEFRCAGSIVHPRAVLTAVHCAKRFKPSDLRVVYDLSMELNLSTSGPEYDFKRVTKIVSHPEYYSGGFHNDIALLILDSPILLTGTVNSICLPRQDEAFDNINCWAAGWGDISAGNGMRLLRKVRLPIVPSGACENLLRRTRLGEAFELHSSFLCAGGYRGEDTCYGDGGGPLMCPISDNVFALAGIVSWGVDCGTANVPGVYTNVPAFRDWVEDELELEDLNLED